MREQKSFRRPIRSARHRRAHKQPSNLADAIFHAAELNGKRRGKHTVMNFLAELIDSQPTQFIRLAIQIVRSECKNIRSRKAQAVRTNRLNLMQAILRATELVGSNGRGRDGRRGYFVRILKSHPRQIARLMGELLVYEHLMEQDAVLPRKYRVAKVAA